ncbi:monooxygenase [Mycolicibacterium moriokaense]|uniref:Monooxygenase n=1 Tax=Mycolicibacterium moriokaense TaxID=39691 RepID=A0AAD1H8P1_9MYCO|nr:NAD(P)/FAD-dependent oxidoreductase [Mycolicibacterium moriokaense]MCV7039165.1 NAD(P)/FAD-dependent oxidoreductase [Mycolicibacterium moriokaense]ORB18551.1 monooxygenase [Mycolicibacterium moriokaense]BBX00069.1 monooxygenase [Mycolicibacterium moriokaense]
MAATSYPTPSPAPQDWVESLRDALADANIPTLLMVLRHLTGDPRWTADPYRPHKGKPLDDNDSGGLPVEQQEEVRAAALDAVVAFREGRLHPVTPGPDEVVEMLTAAMVEEIPAEYGELLSEEMGFISREVEVPAELIPEGFHVVIIGAGLSGLAMGIQLGRAGINYTIVEKDDDIGGTWLENVYPGCGVDTPGHLYAFSFAPNAEISRYFAPRAEVEDYLQRLTSDFELRPNIRFNTEVTEARFDVAEGRWRVETRSQGRPETLTADVVISAVGMVNRPQVPALPGLDEFPGPVLHTAAWDPSVDLAGKRVAVIGTGASAMQLVPAIVSETEHVTIFQRSKQWAVPHPNYHRDVKSSVQLLMREVPFYLQWYRLRAFWNFSDRLHSALQIDPSWPHPERSVNEINERHRRFLTKYIKEQLGDRTDLVDACVPDYPPYGKRPLIDNKWYKTMLRDDVSLVTDAVDHLDGNRLVTTSGKSVEADVVALATGFKVLQFLWPMEIIGSSGNTLREQWGVHDARAYLGVTVPDFPNFFILNGPNTNAGHGGSAIHSTEFQVRYVMQALRSLFESGSTAIDVDRDTFLRYNQELDEALSQSIWSHPGMTTYYRNEFGRIVVSSPWKYVDYWERTREFDPSQYHQVG